jgi:Flp pilus assembly protein TadG
MMKGTRMNSRMGERGQALPLIGLSLMVLMGIGAATIDVSYLEYQQTRMQSATDAAAIAGAQALVTKGCPDSADAKTAADNDSQVDNFTAGPNTTITVDNPPTALDGPYQGNSCAVAVNVKVPKTTTWFLKLFGYSSMPVETSAVALMTNNNKGCIFMLSPVQNTNFNTSTVTAPTCDILINGTANFHSSTVDAAMIGEANYAGSNNGGTFTGAAPAAMLPVADPCPEIPGCAAIANNPPSTSPCTATVPAAIGGVVTMNAGCYNNANLNKATVVMTPGTYVFEGGPNFNQANITATGVTIYIPAGATPPNFNGASALNLSAPTAGNTYAGVSYYQVPANGNDVNFNGSSTNVGGLIYAPSAQLNYNGSLGQYTVVVAAYGNLNGSVGLDFGTPVGQSLINGVVLVQ